MKIHPDSTTELENTRIEKPYLRVRRFSVLLSVVISTVFVFYTVHPQLPPNALSIPGEEAIAKSAVRFFPQGWSFFTKSPRSEDITAYTKVGPDAWRHALNTPHGEPWNFFGLNRTSRAQGVETALLLQGVGQKKWRTCVDRIAHCLAKNDMNPILLRNQSPAPTVCGHTMFVGRRPVPWAYRDLTKNRWSMERVLRAEVVC